MATRDQVGMLKDQKKRIPKVSIGMPVYNGEPFIYKALDSLLTQTFADFELIISDNASTDQTGKICREYASKDPRIRYVRQVKNNGAVANFQYVLDEANGEYFMWAACDDIWDQNCLKKWVAVLIEQADVVLVFSNFSTYFHNSEKVILNPHVSPSLSNNKSIRLIQRMLNSCPSMFYALIKRVVIKDIKLKNFDWADLYFANYLALKGKIVVLTDYLYFAGVKEFDGVRIVKNAKNGKLRTRDYLFNMFLLIWRECAILYALALSILLLKQVSSFKQLISEGGQRQKCD